jgi:hypothetical protein
MLRQEIAGHVVQVTPQIRPAMLAGVSMVNGVSLSGQSLRVTCSGHDLNAEAVEISSP